MMKKSWCKRAAGLAVVIGMMVSVAGCSVPEESKSEASHETRESEAEAETTKTSRPGAGGLLFLPYLQGAQQSAGVTGAFLNISLGSEYADFIRALLEGCAYSIRYNMEEMEEASGMKIEKLMVCGGGSGNPFWLQIFADILKKPLMVSQVKEDALTGAAMLARSVIDNTVSEGREIAQKFILPDRDKAVVYDHQYISFKKAFEHEF